MKKYGNGGSNCNSPLNSSSNNSENAVVMVKVKSMLKRYRGFLFITTIPLILVCHFLVMYDTRRWLVSLKTKMNLSDQGFPIIVTNTNTNSNNIHNDNHNDNKNNNSNNNNINNNTNPPPPKENSYNYRSFRRIFLRSTSIASRNRDAAAHAVKLQLYGLVSIVRSIMVPPTTTSSSTTTSIQKKQQQQQKARIVAQSSFLTNNNNDPISSDASSAVSVCLFLRDEDKDQHALIEWLAYHYQILPLRFLIMAVPTDNLALISQMFQQYSNNRQPTAAKSGLSPSSASSSLVSLNLTIVPWIEDDYLTNPIVHEFLPTPNRVPLREREGVFYYRCLQAMQDEERRISKTSTTTKTTTAAPKWVWLARVDEYLSAATTTSTTDNDNKQHNLVLPSAQTSLKTITEMLHATERKRQEKRKMDGKPQVPSPPCLPIKYQFALAVRPITNKKKKNKASSAQSSFASKSSSSLQSWDTSWMQTFHAMEPLDRTPADQRKRQRQYLRRKINLLDITQLNPSQLMPPIRHDTQLSICERNKWSRVSSGSDYFDQGTSLQVINLKPQNATTASAAPPNSIGMGISYTTAFWTKELSQWLPSLIQRVGEPAAKELLLQHPQQRLKNQISPANAAVLRSASLATTSSSPKVEERCALLFFGLPRAYGSMVLPSIERNVLVPNARHGCDIFVHYYHDTVESSGRMNSGGAINPKAILELHDVALHVARTFHDNNNKQPQRLPHVQFAYDTNETFWYLRNATAQRYRTVKDNKGKLLYFPYNAISYAYPSSLDNIVKQWHSIEAVWNLMDRTMRQFGGTVKYNRVGMFRNDVLYATPIDIYRTSFDDTVDDTENRFAIYPPFCLYPVNDRMIYGSYDAVKIWATKRFEYIEDHVRNHPWGSGYGMQSEQFIKWNIFVAMENLTRVNVTMNPDICFFRTRADESIMINDCEVKGVTRGIEKMNKMELIRDITGYTNCTQYNLTPPFEAIRCVA